MSDGHDRKYEAGVDREISLRAIVYTGAVLALVVVVFAALMWWLSVGLRSSLKAADPPPPVLPEAQTQELPPEPRLQTGPEEDLRLLRQEENEVLHGYSWVDEGAGIAQVPIDRAMEILAAGGMAEQAPERPEGDS